MTLETFPAYKPSQGSGLKAAARLRKSQLGDGYTQVATAGLNHITHSFDAQFEARPTAEITAIEAFLLKHGGWKPFLFAVPGESEARRWRCESWVGPTWVSAKLRSLRAIFVEDFGL